MSHSRAFKRNVRDNIYSMERLDLHIQTNTNSKRSVPLTAMFGDDIGLQDDVALDCVIPSLCLRTIEFVFHHNGAYP